MEELAHYYDAVVRDAEKAQHYARMYVKKAEPALEKIKSILSELHDRIL